MDEFEVDILTRAAIKLVRNEQILHHRILICIVHAIDLSSQVQTLNSPCGYLAVSVVNVEVERPTFSTTEVLTQGDTLLAYNSWKNVYAARCATKGHVVRLLVVPPRESSACVACRMSLRTTPLINAYLQCSTLQWWIISR